MNYTINEIRKYGINLLEKEIVDGLIQLGHEVEEVINLNIDGLIVGAVVECSPHPTSDKLSCTVVDIGEEKLKIVCGAPNVRSGLKVIVAKVGTYIKTLDLTIKPVEIRGEQSNGMLCSLEELGFPKAVLNQNDIDGICELDANSPVGTLVCDYLNLNDKVLDVSLTADRGDCQNYVGVINDLKAYSNHNGITNSVEENLWDDSSLNYDQANKIQATVSASNTIYYSTQLIENVEVKSSSLTNQITLMKNGIKPQNNFVDISNYSLLKYGIPTHMFDADKIVGDIVVKKSEEKSNFKALDGVEYQIDQNTLVICDSEKIIALAGVIGSEDTKVTADTKNILLEIAIFDPTEVRLAAKQIGFKTEASIRYEKGVNYGAINSTRNLINSNINGQVNEPFSAIDNDYIYKTIKLNYKSIKRVLGIKIEKDIIKSILNDLLFTIEEETEDFIVYKVPMHRHDVEYENDLIEEVIRVYGIDNIEIDDHLPGFNKISKIHDDTNLIIERKLENALLSSGLSQVVTYSLTSVAKVGLFNFKNNNFVQLNYPISKERSVYRQSLVNSLIETAKYNLDRQQTSCCIFEIADTYSNVNDEIIQNKLVSGLMTGNNEAVYLGANRLYDFFDLKSCLVASLNELAIFPKFEAVDLKCEQLNKYASANIYVGETLIGYIATIHPSFVKKAKYLIHVFELDFEVVAKLASLRPKYNPISNAPLVERDFTIITSIDTTYDEVTNVLTGVNYIQEVSLVDIYDGDHIEAGMKSYTIKVLFAKNDETLTSEQVEKEVKIIMDNINSKGFKI